MTEIAARRPRPGRTTIVLLLPVLALVLGWSLLNQSQQDWAEPESVSLTLHDRHFRLSPEQAMNLQQVSRDYMNQSQSLGEVRLEAAVEQGVDRLMDGVEGRIPEFLDWYYSLGGEYSRLFWAGASAVGLSSGDYVAAKASETLFPDHEWEQSLELMEVQVAGELYQHSEQSREGWLAALEEMLRAHEVPAPLEQEGGSGAAGAAVDLTALAEQLQADQSGRLETRAGMATMAAGGVAAGPAIWRAVRQRATASGAGAAGARGAGRAAGRGATAAAGGATLCAPTGPGALGCALIAGAVTWAATDAALLKLDEALNRDELEEALQASLQELEETVRDELIAVYHEQLEAHYAMTVQGIERTLVPLDRIRSG